MSGILRAYQGQLVRRPLFTQCWSAGVLFIAGDLVAQQAVDRKGLAANDWARTLRMAAYGSIVAGPLAIGWYRLLERIPTRTALQGTLARVALDQLVAAPLMTTVFFSLQTLMAGGGGEGVRARLDESLWPTLKTNYLIWPFVQLANFHYVPLNYRPLIVNTVAIGWNAYLSRMQNKTPLKQ